MRRDAPHKVDDNQKEIVDFLLKVGCSVLDTSAVGGGFPDLIIGYKNKNILIEIKNPKTRNKLNKLQKRFFESWDGPAFVVYSIEEALEVLSKF